MLHFAYGIANEDIIYFREGIPRVFGRMLFGLLAKYCPKWLNDWMNKKV